MRFSGSSFGIGIVVGVVAGAAIVAYMAANVVTARDKTIEDYKTVSLDQAASITNCKTVLDQLMPAVQKAQAMMQQQQAAPATAPATAPAPVQPVPVVR